MAWIYFQELAASAKGLKNGSDQSPIVKVNDTLKAFCCRECNQVKLMPHRSGMTCEQCTRVYLLQNQTSSMADSPVKTSVLQAAVMAWMESEAVFFMRSPDLQVKFDRDSFSWKTSQLSLFGGLTEFSWNSLRWGMIVDGRLFQPRVLAPLTSESDGSCLPTPVASRCGYQSQGNGTKRYMLPQLWKMGRLPTPTARDRKDRGQKADMNRNSPSLPTFWKATHGTNMPPSFCEWIMGYPIGHTVLSASVMRWYLSKSKRPTKS